MLDDHLSIAPEKDILLWNANDLTLVKAFSGHTLGVNDIAFTSDSSYIVSGSDDTSLMLWDVDKDQAIRVMMGHLNYVFCVAISPKNNVIASGSFDESVRLWDLRNGECIAPLPAHSDPVTSVCFSNTGNRLITCSYEGIIRLWDVRMNRCLRTFPDPENNPISCVKFSPNNKYILASTLGSEMRLWEVDSSSIIPKKNYTGYTNTKYCIESQFTSTNILSGSEDGTVNIWKPNQSSPVAKLQIHNDVVLGISPHPEDETRFVSGGMDCSLISWKWEDEDD
eukprot:TRINITY_DN2182_c0_g1_i1.p1 TRINITY_DN2182_c0_g1~~TRINITY_DN2182_c0_g1_i1.p1  ORF type:complete len:281 (+),score=64.62 TRINITY_DN2182_c0_g1_i1:156-998(+)